MSCTHRIGPLRIPHLRVLEDDGLGTGHGRGPVGTQMPQNVAAKVRKSLTQNYDFLSFNLQSSDSYINVFSAWIRETGLDSQLRIQCAAAAAAVSSSSNNNRSWLLGGGGGDSRDPERQLPRTGDDSAASNSDNEQASPVSDR